jgi:hypothetical protein
VSSENILSSKYTRTAHLPPPARFVRRTQLDAGEYRKNFRQIDQEIINAVTSQEADLVTPLMSKIYLRLINAPVLFWEREGVLRFTAQADEEGKSLNAWKSLCGILGVASATARKALSWMHETGVIGYFAGKNGVGIRIFLNRATSSIGHREGLNAPNVLRFRRTSNQIAPASPNEAPSNDSFAVLEELDLINYRTAPQLGAEKCMETGTWAIESIGTPPAKPPELARRYLPVSQGELNIQLSTTQLLGRLRDELEVSIQQAARQSASREHERTREWLDKHGLPKVARVAQREAYNVLRKLGVINEAAQGSRTPSDVGRSFYSPANERTPSSVEIEELAGACLAMLETKGQPIHVTVSEMSSELGGFLNQESAHLVRERAKHLVSSTLNGEELE